MLQLILLLLTLSILSAQTNYSQIIKDKKIYPMGEKIYNKKCSNIVPTHYKSMQIMQEDIKKNSLCKSLNNGYFEALSLYLWEYKRENSSLSKEEKIVIQKSDKCPVCGMFIYKYPRWAGQIFYKNKYYSFDGVKDLMKYYFEHTQNIEKILVTDYYSQKAIDATKAFYVIDSDIYGPMGNELIPFKQKSEAKTFYMDHRGSRVLSFEDIKEQIVYKLDE